MSIKARFRKSLRHSIYILVSLISLHSIVFAQTLDMDFETDANAEWAKTERSALSNYTAQVSLQLKSWHDYQNLIKRKWSDAAIPQDKEYVQYFDDETSRIKINYESGVITIEALLDKSFREPKNIARKNIQSAMNAMVDKNDSSYSLLLKDEVASNNVDYTTVNEESTKADDGRTRTLYRVILHMVPDHIKKRVQLIKPLVRFWANKYHLDPTFVLAVIRAESAFNPRARSSVPAFGLMQIVPKYAGQEVMKVVTGKAVMPEADFLYDPSKNIMVGCTYLQLLRDKYFADVKDDTKKMYLIASAYNWGPNRIRKLIIQGRIPASSADTFEAIQRFAPDETKAYVRKVSQYYIEFKKEEL